MRNCKITTNDVEFSLDNTEIIINSKKYCVIQSKISKWDRIVSIYIMAQSKEGKEILTKKGNLIYTRTHAEIVRRMNARHRDLIIEH